jgi:hypothetical protein
MDPRKGDVTGEEEEDGTYLRVSSIIRCEESILPLSANRASVWDDGCAAL